MKIIIVYLLFYIAVCGTVFFSFKKMSEDKKARTEIVTGVNTSSFKEGTVIVRDENGIVRIACDFDTVNYTIGFTTVSDSVGEIIFKHE